MPVQTFLMADMRKSPEKPPSPAQQHRNNVGKGEYNRFGPLSSGPIGNSFKPASNRKRPLDGDGHRDSPGKIPKLDANKVFDQLKVHDTLMAVAKNTLTEVGSHAAKVGAVDDGGIGTVLYKFGQVLDALISSQDALKSTIVDVVKAANISGNVGTNYNQGKRQDTGHAQGNQESARKLKKPPPCPADVEKAKIKKILREAERRVIAFDLDLGSAPIMNKTTISKNVTLDLQKRIQSGNHDWAVDSAATVIDDILSCAQLEFLGSGTRKFYNSRDNTDTRNNKMCTIPVRFDFRTKEQRIRAENALKKICKVRTSVPYPKKLREALASLVEQGKQACPGKFVMTKVDVENLSVSAFVRGEKGWTDLNLKKDISSLLIDTSGVSVSDMDSADKVSEEIEIS